MDRSKMLDRIIKHSGVPNLLDILVNRLKPTDLQSLLMEVYSRRIEKLTAADLLHQYQQNRFCAKWQLPARLNKWLLSRWPFRYYQQPFKAVELSPVAPLGANAVVATVDPRNAVATIRNTEVCSDNTNVMALACAVQRRQYLKADHKSIEQIHLASAHRLLRPQLFDFPGAFPHFKVFALCSAGRDYRAF